MLTPENPDGCLLQEDSKGYALVDPVSMEVIHLEIITPHHLIISGSDESSPVVGRRVLILDYKPAVLGEEAFWLPSAITMRATSGSGTFHRTSWSFQATYRNYHKLQVTSRVHASPE